jgi:rod shape-determining protein MreD
VNSPVNSLDYRPFAPVLPPSRARALPWLTVLAGSMLTLLPTVAPVPVMPPFGLLMLLAWRLLARFSLRPWAPAALGLADDLLSGQPLGSAALLWSLCFFAVEAAEQRLMVRTFWQDWLIAAILIAAALAAGRLLASPFPAVLALPVAAQVAVSILSFPAASAVVGWIDRRRNYA